MYWDSLFRDPQEQSEEGNFDSLGWQEVREHDIQAHSTNIVRCCSMGAEQTCHREQLGFSTRPCWQDLNDLKRKQHEKVLDAEPAGHSRYLMRKG